MEAIGNAGSAIVMLSKDGVVLIGEKKVISKLLQTSASSEKVYKIDDHMACVVARILSNANILINTGRIIRMISDDITTEEAVQLSFKVLGKTMDNTSLTPEKLELAEVFLSNGKFKYQACSLNTLNKILLNTGLTQPATEET
ncbi:Proteasome subunit alpha type-4 [Capsicum annuum]|uniref:Proteasome subunit alpha type-4 n=1 Tax=Capsicum annuum TaxID=4072 RepID=A0A2G2YSH5_CAPAN|nr:Proteasome subunit alpha type-4 [Capsicum annuum]